MAIVYTKEISGQSANIVKDNFQKSYTRTFKVITDSEFDDLTVALSSPVLPRLGDIYATATGVDTGVICKTVNAEQEENPKVWIVTAEYDNARENPNQQENEQQSPTDRPTKISFSFQQFEKPVDEDRDGNGVVNSAGDAFDPPPMMDDSRPVVSIEKNFSSFNFTDAIDYQDAINSDSFLGFEPGQAKIASINAEKQKEQGQTYWTVRVEIHLRREGWKLKILDQGYNYIDDFGDSIQATLPAGGTNGDEVLVSAPILLDGDGARLTAGSDPVYLEFDVYREKVFASLNLI